MPQPCEKIVREPDRGKRARAFVAICAMAAGLLIACNDNPLDSGFPRVEIVMDDVEFVHVPVGGTPIPFIVANRGPGTAHFEGCPDPVNIVVEWYDEVADEWVNYEEPNACLAGQTPNTLSLEPNQGYAYELSEAGVGLFRFRVTYGSEPGVATGHFADSPDYAIR